MFKWNIFYFSMCSLSLYTTEKSLTLPSLLFPIKYLYTLIRYLQAFSRLNSCSSPASPHIRCSSPLINFMALHRTSSNMFMSVPYWGAQDWTQHSRYGLTRAELRGSIPSLNLLARLCLMQSRMLLASL